MSSTPVGQGLSEEEVQIALATLASPGDRATAWAVLLAAGDPPRTLWANRAATALFDTANARALDAQIFASRGRGGLAESLARLPVDAPPRLERLRLIRGFRSRTLTISVHRTRLADGRSIFILAIPGSDAGARTEFWSAPGLETTAEHTTEEAPGSPLPGEPQEQTETSDDMGAASGVPGSRPSERGSGIEEPGRAQDPAGGARAVQSRRLVWRTDAMGRLVHASASPAGLLGVDLAQAIGKVLPDVVAELGVDLEGRLAEALAARRTFGGLHMLWPISEPGRHVPLTFGGIPVRSDTGGFDGFRGYVAADPSRVSEVVAAQSGDVEQALPSDGNPDPVEEEAPVPSDSPAPTESVSASDEAAAAELPALTAPIDGRDSVGAGSARGRMSPDEGEASEPGSEAEPPARRLTSYSSKVVALRPYGPTNVHAMAFAPARDESKAVPEIEAGAAEPSVEPVQHDLSLVERTAFQEIGRTLAARFAGAESPLTVAALSTAAAASKPDEIRPVAPAGLDLLPVLDHVPAALSIVVGGTPTYANPAFMALTGYDSAAALARAGAMEELLGPDPSAGAKTQKRRVALASASGQPLDVEVSVEALVQDGQDVALVLLTPAARIPASNGPAPLDLSPAIESRALATILDSVSDAVAIVDQMGAVQMLNGSGLRLFGRSASEAEGLGVVHLIAPESHADILRMIVGASGLDAPATVLDVTGRHSDGSDLPLQMTMRRIDESRICLAWSDRSAEILERTLAEARHDIDEAKALKSDFLAKVSHEIRTPLNAILGFAEVILDERFGPIGNRRYRDYLRDIHDSGAHVMSLVNDLLDLSKMEAGRLDMSVAAVDVNRLVGECVSQMQAQAHRERVIMRMSLVPGLPAALVDERAFRQVMANILSNAVNFNEPGGQVIVSTAMNDSGAIAVRVRDTGIGMSESEIAEAMEPFRQISTGKLRGGTGLGLPLTKALVEANQATLTIKSRKDEGTLVEVVLRTPSTERMRVPAE